MIPNQSSLKTSTLAPNFLSWHVLVLLKKILKYYFGGPVVKALEKIVWDHGLSFRRFEKTKFDFLFLKNQFAFLNKNLIDSYELFIMKVHKTFR